MTETDLVDYEQRAYAADDDSDADIRALTAEIRKLKAELAMPCSACDAATVGTAEWLERYGNEKTEQAFEGAKMHLRGHSEVFGFGFRDAVLERDASKTQALREACEVALVELGHPSADLRPTIIGILRAALEAP